MDNDETTAPDIPESGKGERPRRRSRPAADAAPTAASTPQVAALSSEATSTQPGAGDTPVAPSRSSRSKARRAPVAEAAPEPTPPTPQRSRRSRPSAASPATPVAAAPLAEVTPPPAASGPRRRTSTRPRRDQEPLPGIEAPPAPAAEVPGVVAQPEQGLIAETTDAPDNGIGATSGADITEAVGPESPIVADEALVSPADEANTSLQPTEVAGEPLLTIPSMTEPEPLSAPEPVMESAAGETPDVADVTVAEPAGVLDSAFPSALEEMTAAPSPLEEMIAGQDTEGPEPREARSASIAAGLREYFAALPDPGDEALHPASFLSGLATELRAAGVAPVATAVPLQTPPWRASDEEEREGRERQGATAEASPAEADLDVSGSLADLDLEHASIATPELELEDDAEPDITSGQAQTEEAEREEDRLYGRARRRRGRRGGRGGFAGRQDQDDEESPFAAGRPTPVPAVAEADLSEAAVAEPEPSGGTTGPAVPAGPATGPRSWKERGPRRPWLAGPSSPSASGQTGFSSGGEGRRLAALPGRERREDDPFGTTGALATAPYSMEAFRGTTGDTALDRVLERQGAMFQAFLERQSRLLESVTTGVAAMRRSVEDLAVRQEKLAGEQRTGLPRAGIFVDAPNVCYAADSSKVVLDYSRMLNYLSRGREVVHAIAYAPITDDARDGQRYDTQRFVAPFARSGYKMVTKPLKRFPDGTAKGNFDIELAIDIVTMSDRLDIIVLVSGDSDFSRLVELVQSRGVRVEVVAFASNVASELVHMADVFIDISQHLEHFRPL